MNIDETLSYIHAVCWRGSVPGLERIGALLARMGDPQKQMRFIHVTGTNGKGSTCAMMASILRAAGYRTGLYTSPFLIRFNERMQVDGRQITDDELCEITAYVRPLADALDPHPTEFEMVTAIAFAYFARHNCDIVVCEVGMGGEFDATNVIPTPEAAVFCNIGLDHTQYLGDTLEKIAATKAGIIKPGCEAVLYRQTGSVEEIIRQRCERLGVPLHLADFDGIRPEKAGLEGQVFDWEELAGLHLPLLGRHQLCNAAVALTAMRVLQKRGWSITEEHIRRGLAATDWPGRFQIIGHDPLFIIDGGHNPQCIRALEQNIRNYLPGRPLTVLTGVMQDKDYHCMYRGVVPYARSFITVTPDNPRSLPAGGSVYPGAGSAGHRLRYHPRRRFPGAGAGRTRRHSAVLRLSVSDRRRGDTAAGPEKKLSPGDSRGTGTWKSAMLSVLRFFSWQFYKFARQALKFLLHFYTVSCKMRGAI